MSNTSTALFNLNVKGVSSHENKTCVIITVVPHPYQTFIFRTQINIVLMKSESCPSIRSNM